LLRLLQRADYASVFVRGIIQSSGKLAIGVIFRTPRALERYPLDDATASMNAGTLAGYP